MDRRPGADPAVDHLPAHRPGFGEPDRLVHRRARGSSRTARADSDLEDVILAAALLAYMIGHFRLTAIVHQGMPDEPTVRKERDPANPPRRPAETGRPRTNCRERC